MFKIRRQQPELILRNFCLASALVLTQPHPLKFLGKPKPPFSKSGKIQNFKNPGFLDLSA
jgi:hypothetical protein